ncbi:MAG: FkbM family methyltransferase [Actinomycetota bacterium]
MNDPTQFVSYAQHGEDVILWRALGDREGGFYVDVGAFDPSDDSVTRALYERGWRGINIEPQPDRLAAFERERPGDTNLSLAIGDRDGTATLTRPPVAGWATTLDPALAGFDSATERTLEVPIRRLDTLLPELGVGRIDILKIDVEGAEPAVVRGFIESSIRPLVCVVEGVAPGLGRAAGDEAVALLVSAGYLHCLFDGLNHYLTTDPTLQSALSLPANPIDGHTLVGIVRLEQERHKLHATIAALAQENLSLRFVASREPAADAAHTSAILASTTSGEAGQLDVLEQTELLGSDLPLPAHKVVPDVPDASALRPPALAQQRSDLDPAIRAARRRSTFSRLLQIDPNQLPRSVADGPLASLLTLAVTDPPPVEAISVLYQAILCREADPAGLTAWTDRLELGEPVLRMARELADSAEAVGLSLDHRSRILSDLIIWESLVALTELGVAAWHPHRTYTPGSVAQEIFIGALFEVTYHRRPSPAEARFEIAKLVGGSGREWLLRDYAARPEVRSRLLGEPISGMRGQLRQRRDRRRHLETFRALVVAAESRQITHLIASLSGGDPVLQDLVRTMSETSEGR